MVLGMLEVISNAQVYFENDIHSDYDIEWLILTLHVAHVYKPVFQEEYEYLSFRIVEDHLEFQGNRYTDGLHQ